tara:strand:+ start:522 stop:953 length:432 start_codon:yes stop_codon:yes gene_type:complete
MDKREAIDALAKFGYDGILVEDEFITQTDGTQPVRNQMFNIADAFEIKVPIETFQPNPNEPKGPLPNHSDECTSKTTSEWEEWASNGVCSCWEESYQGIAPMHLLEMVAQKYSVYSNKFGRGSAYREKIQKLKEIIYGEPIGN